MFKLLFITALLLLNINSAFAVTFDQCQFDRVVDGDTIRVNCSKERRYVRLYCIDASEKTQLPYGPIATAKLKELLAHTRFVVQIKNKDLYGRYVGEITREDGLNVNQEMVKSGNAAVYLDYCKDSLYFIAEQGAKKDLIGIWSTDNKLLQQTPWIYRYNKKHNK